MHRVCRISRARSGARLRISYLDSLQRRAYTLAPGWKPLEELADAKLDTFRSKCFFPSQPALLPRGHFLELPAVRQWFTRPQQEAAATSLNYNYLSTFGSTVVPLELSRLKQATAEESLSDSFQKAEVPFQIFLEWTKIANAGTSDRLYLAQASLGSLPQALANDLPTPEIVAKAGVGDIYDANVWMGIAPTYTPLHRDPNPNVFIQLAGCKTVRMLPPEAGHRVFSRVQSTLGRSGSATFREEDMMIGEEKELLESEIWDDHAQVGGNGKQGLEAHLSDGDSIFIPKGWWHSIKGSGGGVLGSVNWWFR